jgi:ribosomal subunit interface protein
MIVYLAGRHLDLTDGLRQHVERHLVEAVERHDGRLRAVRLEVQLDHDGHRARPFTCHVRLELPTGEINIREEANDLYAAIDIAESRLIRALSDHHDRVVDRQQRNR